MNKLAIGLGDVISESKASGSRILTIRDHFENKGFEVSLFSYSDDSTLYSQSKQVPNILKDINESYKLAKSLVDYSYRENAILLSRGIYLAIFVSLLSLRKDIKFGFDFHCKIESIMEWFFVGKYFRCIVFAPLVIFSIMRCDFIVGITPSICNYSNKMFNKRTFLIPNGIDPDKINQLIDDNYSKKELPNKEKYLFFIGHKEPWISIDDMLQASNSIKDYGFVVIGASEDYNKYSFDYPNVIFLGPLSHKDTINLAHHYADYFFHPYVKSEIWKYKSSRKLLEYLVLDKPIIVNTRSFLPDRLKRCKKIFDYNYDDFSELLKLLQSDEINAVESNTDLEISDFSWKNFINISGFIEYSKII